MVCALFSMIVRLADSLGWDVPPWETDPGRARRPCWRAGYALGTESRGSREGFSHRTAQRQTKRAGIDTRSEA